MALKKYTGAVIQPPLDWYARIAQSAQQWFSTTTASYWSFSLQNNANDGSSLWIYDVAAASGPAFPAGTGNPGGNPNAVAGYQGSGGTPAAWALINKTNFTANNIQSIAVPAPAGIVAGRLIVMQILAGALAASFIQPPDATWTLLASADGNSNSPALASYAHIATASEPASWTFTHTAGSNLQMGASASQWSGNANPGVVDVGAGNVGITASGAMIAPALSLTAPGDLVFTAYGAQAHGQSPFTGDASFTMLDTFDVYSRPLWIGYKTVGSQGVAGPFVGTQNPAEPYGAVSFALKASVNALAPAQYLSGGILTQSPVAPGLLTMQFSTNPVGLPGVTKFLPAACDYRWSRDAPIAIIGPGLNFNVAGITPENAAWCDMTWLALRA